MNSPTQKDAALKRFFYLPDDETRVNDNLLACHGRILRSRYKGVRTIIQQSLLFQGRQIFGGFDSLFAVSQAPLRQEEAWENRVDSYLWTLCSGKTFHYMQPGSLRNRVAHTATPTGDSRHGGRDDESTTIWIGVEYGRRLLHQNQLGHDVGRPALVPLIMAKVVDIAKGCESGPASVVDDNIQTSEFLYSLLDQADTVFYHSNVCLNDRRLDPKVLFAFFGDFIRFVFAAHIIDHDIRSFSGKLLADQSPQAS